MPPLPGNTAQMGLAKVAAAAPDGYTIAAGSDLERDLQNLQEAFDTSGAKVFKPN